MTLLLRAQMNLFAAPPPPSELLSFKRREAVAHLRTLLMEALTKSSNGPSGGTETDVGNE